jgi:hypothetical protein
MYYSSHVEVQSEQPGTWVAALLAGLLSGPEDGSVQEKKKAAKLPSLLPFRTLPKYFAELTY